MTNHTIANNFSFVKSAEKSVPDLADVEVPELHQDTIPNNCSFMKYALKEVPGVADVGDPHGGEDGPRVWIKNPSTSR